MMLRAMLYTISSRLSVLHCSNKKRIKSICSSAVICSNLRDSRYDKPMKASTSHEFDRFTHLVDRVLTVPKTEILRREAEYEKQAALNPKRRGPKRKIKPSGPVPAS